MALGRYAYVTPFDEPWEYASFVGMLIYLSRNSRPEIQFTVNQCDRLNQNPSRSHAEAVNRICLYLVGTPGQGLTFDPNSDINLEYYMDEYFSRLFKHEDGKESTEDSGNVR